MNHHYCMKNGSLERVAAAAIIGAALGANAVLRCREMMAQQQRNDMEQAAQGAVLGATVAIFAGCWTAHSPKDTGRVRAVVTALLVAPLGLAMVAAGVDWARKQCRLAWVDVVTFTCCVATGRIIGQRCNDAVQHGANPHIAISIGVVAAAAAAAAGAAICVAADALIDWTRPTPPPPADEDDAAVFAYV